MGCRRPLSMEDRAAIGAGLESGLCQARIARMLGRSPSVIRGEIKRNAGADGCYRGEEAGRMAARRRARPKERAIDADPVLRSRVVSDLARGRTPRQISGRLKARGGRDGAGGPRGLIICLEAASAELRAQTVKLARHRGRPPVPKGPTSEVDGLGRTPASSCWDAPTEPTRPSRSPGDRSAQRPARVPGPP